MDELFEALQRSALDLLAEGPKYVQAGQLESLRTAIAGIRKERNAEFDKVLWRYEDLLTNMELQKGIVQDFDWAGMLEVLVQRADDVAKKEQKVTDQTVGMVCLQLCRACEEGLKELRGVAGGNGKKLEGTCSFGGARWEHQCCFCDGDLRRDRKFRGAHANLQIEILKMIDSCRCDTVTVTEAIVKRNLLVIFDFVRPPFEFVLLIPVPSIAINI